MHKAARGGLTDGGWLSPTLTVPQT
jgi:hypothetical protein